MCKQYDLYSLKLRELYLQKTSRSNGKKTRFPVKMIYAVHSKLLKTNDLSL